MKKHWGYALLTVKCCTFVWKPSLTRDSCNVELACVKRRNLICDFLVLYFSDAFSCYYRSCGLWTQSKMNNKLYKGLSLRCFCIAIYVTGSERRGNFALFKLSPQQGLQSPWLPTSFTDTLGLLIHRSNIKSYNMPPVVRGKLPKWDIKQAISNRG